jgi:hypothetical protein
MISALVPTWILGASLIALVILNAMFNGGTSSMRDGREDLSPDADTVGYRR